ncbi:hypothetical protein L226DRAFT_617280, partial [Lentinus tigrinus ALCF2SS1-7]|uniref:F-box domain-containing protein n=1 Tax=Lentinus tigrinus ALCF2SS1-6 TaxID=1328759 RepID=A0A5C2RQD8_9APHY
MAFLTTLAPELLLKILACLLKDPPSLLRCAHVCRALRPYALEVFFRDIELVETTKSVDRTREFAELLESNHTIASCIRTLRLAVDLSRRRDGPISPVMLHFNVLFEDMRISYGRETWADPSEYPYVLGNIHLHRLSYLRDLALDDGMMLKDPVREVVAMLQVLPRLERLRLRGVLVASMSPTPRTFQGSIAALPVAKDKPHMSLKTLELDYAPKFPLYELVRQLLEEFGDGLRLESLVARCPQWENLVEHHAGWIPFISAMKASLRHLDISTGERDYGMLAGREGSDDTLSCHTSLFDVLRECEDLRTLRLDYILPTIISRRSIDLHRADFLQSLCVLLESRPALSDHLEQLTLDMVDWNEIMVSVDRTLADRLSRVLTDAKHYPEFKMFRLEVLVEDALYSDEEMPTLEEENMVVFMRWIDVFDGFLPYSQQDHGRVKFKFTVFSAPS